MMKKSLLYSKVLLLMLFLTGSVSLNAQVLAENFDVPGGNPESCTSIMVGKKATTDGSVITSHTCDGNYRTWMEIVPARNNKSDATIEIYKGLLHTENPKDRTGVTVAGTIPDAPATYAYFNTGYPAMNEKALVMGETTITGRRELVNKKGMFLIEELQKIALQRTTTAREAIKLMGEMAKKYGYGDSGECLTIADGKEVWQFEIFGEGPDKLGAVWAAVRIPDDHVGVSANIPRISTLNLNDKENYMASENVYEVGKKMGFWDGKEPFKFWKVYGGVKKPYAIRDFFILNAVAPSLKLNMDMEELPFSVKPEKQLSVLDVAKLQKSYYEGTQYDPTKNLLVEVKDAKTGAVSKVVSPYANPWMNADAMNMLNAIKPGTVDRQRLISVPQCAYFTIIQVRDWLPEEVSAVAWVGLDNPGQSPRFPVYSGTLSMPADFMIDGQHSYREDAAVWAYRRANKLSSVKWGATRGDIEKGVAHFENKALAEMPLVEARAVELIKAGKKQEAKEMVTNYVHDFAGATQKYWWLLGDKFWMIFARGI